MAELPNSPLDGLAVIPRPIIGWRCFAVEKSRMRSLFFLGDEAWWDFADRGWHEAVCRVAASSAIELVTTRRPMHAAPHPDCKCGFYVAKSRRDLVLAIGSYKSPATLPQVVAKVMIAGRVVIHENGWRAQKLRILACWPTKIWAKRVLSRCSDPIVQNWLRPWSYYAIECHHDGLPGCDAHRWNGTCKVCGRPNSDRRCWYPK